MIRINLRVPGSIRASSASGRIRRGERVVFGAPPNALSFVPLETIFHKIVMIRNNLRVLEQKGQEH